MNKKPNILLKNAVVLTMNEAFDQFEPGAVAVSGDSIIDVGPESIILERYNATETVDYGCKVLMPGLINAHTHVPMTLLRGIADDLRLDVWLLGYMMPVEREFVSPEFVRLGTQIACLELIRSGSTCFVDMYYFEDDVAEATAEIGLRAICGQTVLKFPAPDAASYEESLAESRDFIKKWKEHSLIVPSIAPHAAYTCTEEILQASAEIATEFDVPLQIHIAETAQEVEDARKDFGMPVVPYLKKQNIFDAKVIAAHCVHIDDGEMNTLQHHHAGVVHNPSSNLKLASGFAQVDKMVKLGLNVGVGTDGPASNNDLDMFEEVRLAALLAKSVAGDPTAIPAQTALAMATSLGAKSIHMDHLIGSIEKGKRADLILVDIDVLHNSPRFRRDPKEAYAQIVYASKSTDVTDVMVNGKWLLKEHELLTMNEKELMLSAAKYAEKIDTFLQEREQSVLSKLVAIGGALQEESFEVQAKVRINDPEPILSAINNPEIEILHTRHYHEYDTYFLFTDKNQGTLRHREDEFVDEKGEVNNVRYRLTLIGPTSEHKFPSDVLLSRSRYLAPANHSLRFYREYFKPGDEIFIEKDRLRWRVLFRGTEFYINLDHIQKPNLGYFLEVKSRTWSRIDADHKAMVATKLLEYLGVSTKEMVAEDYLELVAS